MNYTEFEKGLIFKGNLTAEKKIVIHNSASAGNAFSSALYNYNKTMVEGLGTGFAHYYVDDNNIIMLARENWVAWHSGNGEMNRNSIGIEICSNPMECYTKCKRGNCDKITTLCAKQEEQIKRFFKAEQNAIDLVHTLLAKWSLTPEDVIFHSDVKKTECPYFTKKLHNLSRASDFLTIFEKPNC